MTDYDQFLEQKQLYDSPSGFEITEDLIHYQLFPFQEAIVQWACKRGRAAIFANTGLGKTRMQLVWADQVRQHVGSVIIFAPLCVSNQTVAEGEKIGVTVQYIRHSSQIKESGVYITNYEMFDHFTEQLSNGTFSGIVLDESSILKHETSKTRQKVIDYTFKIPYRLSCTATPSPNDFMELGNQAEFLGVMTMTEMLAMFFTHDGGETSKWRLKGHGKTKFWEWMSQWATCIQLPSDLGFSDEGYNLPPLDLQEHIVGEGLSKIAKSMQDRNKARRESVDDRVAECAALVNADTDQWIVWCHLNDESAKLAVAIPGSVEVTGSDSIEKKESALLAFTRGEVRVLVTKPSIAGFGMNWQHCHKMAFVGLNDSYEELYQGIRRCYRFGQKHSVQAHLFSANTECMVLRNIRQKERQHHEMSKRMVEHMQEFSKRTVLQLQREKAIYEHGEAKGEGWNLYLADCVEASRELANESVDYSVFSPPFSSLYTYSNSERDMGNSKTDEEFWQHFRFLIKELYRILRSGRNISVHCMNLPTSKARDGYIGIRDFRGEIIREFQKEGFIYHSEVVIWKDPVTAMQRTKALGLLWKQIKKDSSMCRQGIPDYVVTFRKPGENTKPIEHTEKDFPVEEWQQLASPCWMDINPSYTLNKDGARDEDDERHICPLQLDVIQRCMRLWSNPGDIVFSPFAGIGSEGYIALRMKRNFIGVELKKSYWKIAQKNLQMATREPIITTGIDVEKSNVRKMSHAKTKGQATLF